MQVERQWKLLKLIPDHRNPRSTEAIWNAIRHESKDYAKISKRTVERDLFTLGLLFPSIGQRTQGRTNLWYWEPDAKMWIPGLTDDEALAFHMVEKNMRELLPEGSVERLSSYFKVAQEKLSENPKVVRPWTQKFRLAPPGVPRIARNFFSPKTIRMMRDAALQHQAVTLVREALLRDQQICLTYSANARDAQDSYGRPVQPMKDLPEPKTAIINPLALIQRDNQLLLIYTERGRSQTEFMPLKAIESARLSEFSFDGPKDFDVDAYIESGALHFGHDLPIPIGDWIHLSASFVKDASSRLFSTPMAGFEKLSQDSDGQWRLGMTIRLTVDLAEWLLSLGPKVRVHRPTALRRWIAQKLAAAADQYRGESEDDPPQHTMRWFDKWDSRLITCSHCNWEGCAPQKELEPSDSPQSTESEFRCPKCNKLLLTVNHSATMKDLVKNWDSLDPPIRLAIRPTPQFLEEFERARLKSAKQLPALKKGPDFLTWDLHREWDYEREREGEVLNVIRHGPRHLWSQPAIWGRAEEFLRVAGILATRYAGVIRELRITPVARGFLSTDAVELRQQIRGVSRLFQT